MRVIREAFLARGKRGVVSTGYVGRKRVAIKRRNVRSAVDTIAHEARMLQLVNEHGIGPKFLSYERGELVTEYIDGKPMIAWIERAQPARIRRAMIALLEQCATLDRLGLNKRELTHPDKHVLIRRGKPVQIDFERCTFAHQPKNVTQVCQWLTGKRMSALLRSRGIMLDRQAILTAAGAYKKDRSNAMMRRVVRLFEATS